MCVFWGLRSLGRLRCLGFNVTVHGDLGSKVGGAVRLQGFGVTVYPERLYER